MDKKEMGGITFNAPVTVGTFVKVESGATYIKNNLPGVTAFSDQEEERQELEDLKRMATGEEVEEEERKGEALRRAIEGTLPMMVNGSQWFCIYRGMVDRELHKKGDYAGFVSRIKALFPGKVPLGINAGDISKLDVHSWSKHLEEWTQSDAPRKGKTYTQYEKIARRFEELLASGD